MKFRKAVYSDLDSILRIVSDAKVRMRLSGSDQWQKGYPNYDTFKTDIDKGILYVVTSDDLVLGVLAVTDYEEAYDDIDGAWLSSGKYYVIHRLAVSEEALRCGVATFAIDSVAKMALNNKIKSIKIDTHILNEPMIRLVKKNGFIHCGKVMMFKTEAREAFERRL